MWRPIVCALLGHRLRRTGVRMRELYAQAECQRCHGLFLVLFSDEREIPMPKWPLRWVTAFQHDRDYFDLYFDDNATSPSPLPRARLGRRAH